MNRWFVVFAISVLTWISIGQCLGDDPHGVMGLLFDPWVTLILLCMGMILLASELMSLGTWGWAGTAGVISLGLALSTHAFGGTAEWLGTLLVLVGFGLLVVEARVLPGYGVIGIAGLISLFLGCYWILGVAAGAVFSVVGSALFTLLTAAAFLVHLPKNTAWQAIGRQLEMSEVRHKYLKMSDPVCIREEVESKKAVTGDLDASTDVKEERQQRLGRRNGS